MRKTRKIHVLALTSILGTGTAFAVMDNVRAASDGPNFYVGAQLGHAMADYAVSRATDNLSVSVAGKGADGGLVLGLSRRLGGTHIGVEVEANLSSVDTTLARGNIDIKITLERSIGLSAIGGINLTPSTMLYARAGIVRSEFELSSGNGSADESENGFRGGLGIQTDINEKMSVRGEYVYTNYSSIEGVVDPSTGLYRMGLIYKF